jgi:hypothetical protein
MLSRRDITVFAISGISMMAMGIGAARAGAVDIEINPNLLPVDQGDSNLCWLAATAVVFGWRDGAGGTLADSDARMSAAATAMGGEFVTLYLTKEALPSASIPNWRSSGGFELQGQQCLDADGWETLLRGKGPLITLIDGNGSGEINHAVVVGGIHGDGSADGTNILFANGNGGIIESKSLTDFATIFEEPSGSDALFSVMYLA